MKILSEILEDVKIIESHGNLEAHVSSVSLSSKNIEPNSVFVAIVGNVVNGHMFIDEVIEKGATVIIHEKDIEQFKNGVTYIKVSDTHMAVGIIASNFYDNPSRKLKLVGVTGTNGKTTTATLLHQLFMSLGYKVGLLSTVSDKICDEIIVTNRATPTTPDSIILNKLLAEMVDRGCTYCFMEVSSHAMAEGRISGITFAGGIFTNLTLDHLNYHGTFENYCDAKKSFFDILPATGFAIANIDDEKGLYMLSDTKAHKYTLSLKKEADFNERLETKLLGEFNIYNVLGVYATAVLLGENKAKSDKVGSPDSFMKEFRDKVKEIIKNLDSVNGRFQSMKGKNGITGIVDYAHTPDALENVLKTANDLKGNGKVIAVIGCGGDKDKSKRPIMAKIGYEMSDILIMTSDNPRSEKPEDILNDMQKGLPMDYEDKTFIVVDRHYAIEKACGLAKAGDYILVAGKGLENYQEVNGLKTHFDDKEELEKYLN
jgi:UDP-N-acetylmuramoyl-L-alanyl-D-glutamate--2,6-diaminopimelate ligase